jgi:hypothetical protein
MFNVKFGATRAVTVALSESDSVNSFIEPPWSGAVGVFRPPQFRDADWSDGCEDETGCSAWRL